VRGLVESDDLLWWWRVGVVVGRRRRVEGGCQRGGNFGGGDPFVEEVRRAGRGGVIVLACLPVTGVG